MKLYLLVSLLGTALASTGQFSYSSFSTAHGPLARSALAYGGYASSALTEISGYSAAAPVYAAAPVTAYAAHAPFTAYAAHAPVTAYAAHAPVAAYAAHTPVTAYAAHAPAYAAAPVATYAATQVATAPATAVVPVTRVSAQPAVVQNVVDVAQPKLATRRFEIRRPAIEKQFYDVEERIVVRPAGSAVVELETPIGAGQRGPTKITAAAPPVALHSYNSAHLATHFTPAVLPAAPVAISAIHHHPQVVEQNQEYEQFQQQQEHVQQTGSEQQQISQQSESVQQIPQQPIPQPSLPQQDDTQQQFDDSESVSIDNPEISVRTGSIASTSGNIPSPLFRSQLSAFPRAEAPLPQFSSRQSFEQSNSDGLPSFSRSRVSHYLQPEPLPLPQQRSELPQQSTLRPEYASARQQQAEFSFAGNQFQVSSSRAGASLKQGPTSQRLLENDVEVNSFGSDRVVSSARHLSPEQSQANQARLIELLTARGPVSEVRSASEPIRGRVISATPAPSSAEPADERINTRRIVVNRPIQTVQEVDVVEPFTKLERVAVHQPAVVKSAHVELAAVPAAVHTAVPAAVTVAPYYHK